MIGTINFSGIGFGVLQILSDPPVTPVPGGDYGIGANATGAWAGHSGKVARADANQVTGWLIFDNISILYDTATRALYDKPNGDWVQTPNPVGVPGPEGPEGPQGPAGPPGSGGAGAGLLTHVKGGANQAISGYSATVDWTGVEVRDDGGWFDPAAPTRITPGLRQIDVSAQLRISNVTNGVYCDFSVKRYDASNVVQEWAAFQRFPAAAGGALAILTSIGIDMADGDYLQVEAGAGQATWTIDHGNSWIRVRG